MNMERALKYLIEYDKIVKRAMSVSDYDEIEVFLKKLLDLEIDKDEIEWIFASGSIQEAQTSVQMQKNNELLKNYLRKLEIKYSNNIKLSSENEAMVNNNG